MVPRGGSLCHTPDEARPIEGVTQHWIELCRAVLAVLLGSCEGLLKPWGFTEALDCTAAPSTRSLSPLPRAAGLSTDSKLSIDSV